MSTINATGSLSNSPYQLTNEDLNTQAPQQSPVSDLGDTMPSLELEQEQYQYGDPNSSVPLSFNTYTVESVYQTALQATDDNTQQFSTVTDVDASASIDTICLWNAAQISANPMIANVSPLAQTMGVTKTASKTLTDPDVQKALDEIGRAQCAYQEYMDFNRTDLDTPTSSVRNSLPGASTLNTMGRASI